MMQVHFRVESVPCASALPLDINTSYQHITPFNYVELIEEGKKLRTG